MLSKAKSAYGGRKLKAFTLVELLVVVVIIGILATLVVLGLQSASRKAKESRAKDSITAVQTALNLYINETGSLDGLKSAGTTTRCGLPSTGFVSVDEACRAAISAGGGNLGSDPLDGLGNRVQFKANSATTYTIVGRSASSTTAAPLCWWASDVSGNLANSAISSTNTGVAPDTCF
jgi:prepilin-type N-terminal cleavage/methylation domain-containing protein